MASRGRKPPAWDVKSYINPFGRKCLGRGGGGGGATADMHCDGSRDLGWRETGAGVYHPVITVMDVLPCY